jgi:hypothetical protein
LRLDSALKRPFDDKLDVLLHVVNGERNVGTAFLERDLVAGKGEVKEEVGNGSVIDLDCLDGGLTLLVRLMKRKERESARRK